MKRHLLYFLSLLFSVVAAAVGSQIRGDSYELLTGQERDLALHMEAYKGEIWFSEAKRDIEAGLQTYREQRGLSQDEMFELLERTLAALLAMRRETVGAAADISRMEWCVAYAGHPRSVDVLLSAFFAEWNSSRISAAYALVQMSPEAALRLLERMVLEREKIDRGIRASIYGWIGKAWLGESKPGAEGKARQEMLGCLRSLAAKEDYSSAAGVIDRILSACDPSWRGSTEREAMAKRFLATYVPEGEERRWPELAMKAASEVTEEVRRNIHNRYTAVLADVETARKEATEKELKSAEAAPP